MNTSDYEDKLKELYRKYECPNYILDGPVTEDYWSVYDNKKVLWVLRETNGSFEENFHNDLRKLLLACADNPNPNESVYNRWKATYGLVVKVSYALLNNEWIENVDNIRSVLKKIAVINIDKRPGGNRFSRKKLKEAQEKFGDIIDTQIDLLKPDIIILGNTFNYISDYIKRRGTIIDMPHPGQIRITHKKYYEELLAKKQKLKI